MSTLNGCHGICPICKTDQEVYAEEHPELGEVAVFQQQFTNCRTNEGEWTCLACGYLRSGEVKVVNGKRFWKQMYFFPMDDDGYVNRPGVDNKRLKAERSATIAEWNAQAAADRKQTSYFLTFNLPKPSPVHGRKQRPAKSNLEKMHREGD